MGIAASTIICVLLISFSWLCYLYLVLFCRHCQNMEYTQSLSSWTTQKLRFVTSKLDQCSPKIWSLQSWLVLHIYLCFWVLSDSLFPYACFVYLQKFILRLTYFRLAFYMGWHAAYLLFCGCPILTIAAYLLCTLSCIKARYHYFNIISLKIICQDLS